MEQETAGVGRWGSYITCPEPMPAISMHYKVTTDVFRPQYRVTGPPPTHPPGETPQRRMSLRPLGQSLGSGGVSRGIRGIENCLRRHWGSHLSQRFPIILMLLNPPSSGYIIFLSNYSRDYRPISCILPQPGDTNIYRHISLPAGRLPNVSFG